MELQLPVLVPGTQGRWALPKLSMVGSWGETVMMKAAVSVLGQGGKMEGHAGNELAESSRDPDIG